MTKSGQDGVRIRAGNQTRHTPDLDSPAIVWGLVALAVAIFIYRFALYRAACPSLTLGASYLSYFLERGDAIWPSLWELDYYPPFYYAFVAAVTRAFGADYGAVLWANTAFPILGVLYLTALSRRLGLGVFSFLPALLTLFAGGTLVASRELVIEAPFFLIIPAFTYHLYASSGFRIASHSLLAGAWAGVGLLAKWTFPAYVVGPVLLVAVGLAYDPANRRRARLTGGQLLRLVSALVICAGIAGWWYVLRMNWAMWAASAGNDPNVVDHRLLSAAITYAAEMMRLLTAGAGAYLAAAFAAAAVLSRRPAALAVGIGLGIVAPLLLFAWPVHSETRYIYPLMPACALAMGFAASTARWDAARVLVAATFAALIVWRSFVPVVDPAAGAPTQAEDPQPVVTDDLIRYIEYRLPDADPLVIAVHPLWNNRHLESEALRFRTMKNREDRLEAAAYNRLEYAAYRRELRSGRFDALLLDCGPAGDCLETDPETTRYFVDLLTETGFVNTMSKEVMAPVTWGDVVADVAWTKKHYRTDLVFPLEDGTHTRVLVRNDAPDPEAAP